MRKTIIATAALAAIAVTAGAAHAASHNKTTFIAEQDLNGDGRVTKDEFAEGREKEFARQDKNGDGGISQAEYIADFKPRMEASIAKLPEADRAEQRVREERQVVVRFGVLDSDKSGAITRAEYAYSGWRMFVFHDTDKDGFVTADDPPHKDDDDN